MAIVEDNFRYKKIKKNSLDSIGDVLINESVKTAKTKLIDSLQNLHCRIHNQVPIIKISGKDLNSLKITTDCCCSIFEEKIRLHLNSNLKLMGNFTEKGKEFAKRGVPHHSFVDRDFVNKLSYEVDVYRNPKHKIEFLEEVIAAIEEKTKKHEETCNATPETCEFSKGHRQAIFFVNEELQHQMANLFGNNVQGENSNFSKEELPDIYVRIDEILDELKKLGLGQEIIFDEIASMKANATKLNKKDFKMLFLGKIVGTGFMALLKNEKIQALYEQDLAKLISGN